MLVWDNLQNPRDVVVDPFGMDIIILIEFTGINIVLDILESVPLLDGFMYWCDWGTSKIEKAYMDGSNRISFIKGNLKWPNGLAIDYHNGRIFWTDAGTKAIESAKLDGSKREVFIGMYDLSAFSFLCTCLYMMICSVLAGTGLTHPFSLALFEDDVYWTDSKEKAIYKANKSSAQPVKLKWVTLFLQVDSVPL